jgi:hypothetical protein
MWYNPKIFELCMRYQIEPVFREKLLILTCSKEPSDEFLQELDSLLPKDVVVEGRIGLKRSTVAFINIVMAVFGGNVESFLCPNIGEVILKVTTPDDNKALDPVSEFWDQIVSRLVADSFTEQYTIYRNGVEVRRGAVSKKEEGVSSVPKIDNKIVVPKSNEDRFDYDREFLPPDVGTDVRIALETTQDSGAFLRSLGVEI